MPRITLTAFVDFTTSEIRGRISRVRTELKRDEYDPRFDFWKPLRERIEDIHRNGESVRTLAGLLDVVDDQKKLTSYPPAIHGYMRFIGRRQVEYFEPPREDWQHGQLTVRGNPELGLVIRNVPYVIKLWFSRRELSKRRCDVTLGLMQEALAGDLAPDMVVAVLDVQRSELYHPTVEIADLDALLAGEASSFLEMYRRMGGR